MNVMEAFPSKFLKADDLQGKEITVQIDHVAMEEVGKDKEIRPALYFRGKEKGIVLNKTNATNIAAAYGPDTDDWTGQPVTLFTTWVDFQGKSVPAIRVRPASGGVKPPIGKPNPKQTGDSNGNGAADLNDDIPF
jgi:hypothetical protein